MESAEVGVRGSLMRMTFFFAQLCMDSGEDVVEEWSSPRLDAEWPLSRLFLERSGAKTAEQGGVDPSWRNIRLQ